MPTLDEFERAFFSEDAFAVPVILKKTGVQDVESSGIAEEALFGDDSDHSRAKRDSVSPQITVPTEDLPEGYTEGDTALYEHKGVIKERVVLDVSSDETMAIITFEE